LAAVGSKNPVKLDGVRDALARFFTDFKVVSVDPETSVPPQPLSLRETVLGAVERAAYAVNNVSEADIGIGVEAGFVEMAVAATGYVDIQVCAIADREKRVSIGLSPGFEFPPVVLEKILSGEAVESEEVMERLTGVKRIGEKMGAIGALTRGHVTRRQLVEQAVIMALVPRLNPGLYPAERLPSIDRVIKMLRVRD